MNGHGFVVLSRNNVDEGMLSSLSAPPPSWKNDFFAKASAFYVVCLAFGRVAYSEKFASVC